MQTMETAENHPIQKRIFIQRDYSQGMVVKFQTRFPPELDDRVSYNKYCVFMSHSFSG